MKKGQDMKVLALNSNYKNQNCNKKNVNFEAVRVDSDAIEGFKKMAPASSLTENLMFWVGKNYLGRKVEAVVRAITGIQADIPLGKVFKKGTGFYSDASKLQRDVFVRAEYNEGELGRLQSAIDKARDEVERQFYLRPEPDTFKQLNEFKLPEELPARVKLAVQLKTEARVNLFDELWEQKGTACNELKKSVEGFEADANSEGHHVTKADILP